MLFAGIFVCLLGIGSVSQAIRGLPTTDNPSLWNSIVDVVGAVLFVSAVYEIKCKLERSVILLFCGAYLLYLCLKYFPQTFSGLETYVTVLEELFYVAATVLTATVFSSQGATWKRPFPGRQETPKEPEALP